MDQRDLELIQKFSSTDSILADLYNAHLKYEKEIEELENRSYLTATDQMRRMELKKKKLAGRDRMEMILKKYRQTT